MITDDEQIIEVERWHYIALKIVRTDDEFNEFNDKFAFISN